MHDAQSNVRNCPDPERYSFRVTIAGKKIEVLCRYKDAFRTCRDYLSEFDTPDLTISVTEGDIKEKKDVLPAPPSFAVDKSVAVYTNPAQIESMLLLLKTAEKLLASNTLLMHGSVVAGNGRAYMFTAPSGTGKTTRSRLWLAEYPDSFIVNDDKPFIRIEDEQVLACGSPWCGKEKLQTNTTVPLKAIYLLERTAEGEKSSIQRCDFIDALPFLLEQTYQPADSAALIKTIRLLERLENHVLIYRFRSSPDVDSIRLACQTAENDRIQQ